MHRYTQNILRRIMGAGKKPKCWSEGDYDRFALECFNKAPSCECGCGEKTYPDIAKGGSIVHCAARFLRGDEDIVFYKHLPYHKNLSSPHNYVPTKEQADMIIASSYGDGCIKIAHSKSISPSIKWNMGHKNHALFKFNKFQFLGAQYKEVENRGFGDVNYTVSTQSHPCLLPFYKKIWVDGKKVANKGLIESMGDVGWAWLYGDDGHLDKRGNIAFIHTEQFGEKENQIFVNALNKYLGANVARIHCYIGGAKKRKLYCVRLTKDGTKEFCKRVKYYMATGMEYKIPEGC